jgi:acetyltransferase-like isoleucine patch superfamily enzyme
MIKIDTPQILNLDHERIICRDVEVGRGSVIWNFVNLYECQIGSGCMIGTFVEIQNDVYVGDRTRIQSHTFICSRVRIGNDCFIAHGVMFINDTFRQGSPAEDSSLWESTEVGDGVSIGSNATILPVKIGQRSVIGAGAVVTRDVPPGVVVAGNPATVVRHLGKGDF